MCRLLYPCHSSVCNRSTRLLPFYSGGNKPREVKVWPQRTELARLSPNTGRILIITLGRAEREVCVVPGRWE